MPLLLAATGYAALLAFLCLQSDMRVTGDGKEYLVLAERFADGQGPSIPIDEARERGVYDSRLIDHRGTQQVWHFWFLSLLVAPLVRALGVDPTTGFVVLNVGLLVAAFGVVYRRLGGWAALFIGCSPILWWVDKAQVEAFTVASVAVGCALIERPHAAAVAFGLAATQNPPFAGVALVLCVVAVLRADHRRLVVWLCCGLTILLSVIHPLYYMWRLGSWTPLVDASDVRIPGLRAFLTVIIDLNVGMIINAPVVCIVLAAVVAGAIAARRRIRSSDRRLVFLSALIALFLLACAQAPNVNSGGTPGISRYALWFVPLPLLLWSLSEGTRAGARLLPSLAILSATWSMLFFRPSLPEHYLWPTKTAHWVWTNHPSWENPLPEIFAERLRHQDGVNTLAATANCAKAILQGGQWPTPCRLAIVPAKCGGQGILCYANRRADGGYEFLETSRRGGIRISTTVP